MIQITHYQLAIASREVIEPFPPVIPDCPVFKKNKAFRSFLISKMINAERKTHQTSDFANRFSRARSGAMKGIAKDFIKK